MVVDGLQSEAGGALNGAEGEFKGMKKTSTGERRALVKLIDLGSTKALKLENIKTAGGVYRTNSFGAVNTKGLPVGCLFEVLSRFNHACFDAASVAKTTRVDEEGDHVADVVTLSDVAEGEELTICYLGDDERELDTAQRRDYLKMKYRFECLCAKCRGT